MHVLVKCKGMIMVAVVLCCCKVVCAQSIDVKILSSINPDNPNSRFWHQTSNSAYWAGAALPAGTLIYGLINDDENAKHMSYDLFISLGANVLLTDVLKKSFNRTRPMDKYPGMIFSSPSNDMSLPSGHTSLAFATATTLSLQFKKWYVIVPAYAWAGSVAYSRMYLGKHYPSDIIGGAIVGVGSGFASHWLNRKLFKRYYYKNRLYER
ncbi:MAG: phosphatase PAP2 family protein [Sphingobacteriaceae bacterium]|nr:MAG: phosphatase PAP2 family protein [Sphingobacteriaceae bacterium]